MESAGDNGRHPTHLEKVSVNGRRIHATEGIRENFASHLDGDGRWGEDASEPSPANLFFPLLDWIAPLRGLNHGK